MDNYAMDPPIFTMKSTTQIIYFVINFSGLSTKIPRKPSLRSWHLTRESTRRDGDMRRSSNISHHKYISEIPSLFYRAFRVFVDTYVTATDGTYIVLQAPAFDEDDACLAIDNGVLCPEEMPPCPLDDGGKFIKPVTDFEGMYIKVADKEIMKVLKAKCRLIVQSTIWRSGTPLIYRAVSSWFIYREHMIVVGLYLQERIEIQAEQTQLEYWDYLDSIRHVESSAEQGRLDGMEHWPVDERHKSLPVKKKQGRGNKRLQVHNTQCWSRPSLDYGTFGRATLVLSDGRLAGTTVLDTSNGRFELYASNTMILNLVRKCFPDADFPVELIKAEFQSDERRNRELQVYDPLGGNVISIVPSSSTLQTSLVLFPVGETNSELIRDAHSPNASNLPLKRGTNPVLVRTLSATSLLSIELPDEGTNFMATREVDILSDETGAYIKEQKLCLRRIGVNQVRLENKNGDTSGGFAHLTKATS
ncbi:hypothetical protein P692DRAFT_20823036 [Suillus brevipes Sb2]|nr:hypothetical protein P692DRAFT_20823036 [Suillus brevipes Sb2]